MARFPKTRSKKQGPVKSKKVVYKGVQLASGLERFMYVSLEDAKIPFKYEGENFELIPSFHFPNVCVERLGNGKGDMIDRGGRKVLGIKYKPDFIIYDDDGNIHSIIETKGRPNDSFPIRWKLFRKLMAEEYPTVKIYKPQKQSECTTVTEMIKKDLKM